jgi:hypothetical protein
VNVVPITPGVTTLGALDKANSPPVDPFGGGGDDGGVEDRLRHVERKVDQIEVTLQHMNEKLDRIGASVSTWKWQFLVASIAVVLSIIAFGVTIQQMTVTTFQAAAQAEGKTPAVAPAQIPPIIINVPPAAAPVPAPRKKTD